MAIVQKVTKKLRAVGMLISKQNWEKKKKKNPINISKRKVFIRQ